MGPPAASAAPVSRLARWLGGLVGGKSARDEARDEADHNEGKFLAARALVLALRRGRPYLGPTIFEAAKTSHNPSVANAMLEAYSRALATHSEAAVTYYQRIVERSGPMTPIANHSSSTTMTTITSGKAPMVEASSTTAAAEHCCRYLRDTDRHPWCLAASCLHARHEGCRGRQHKREHSYPHSHGSGMNYQTTQVAREELGHKEALRGAVVDSAANRSSLRTCAGV